MDQHLKHQETKCLFCGQFFKRDRRVGRKQKACRRQACQKQRKRAQERKWRKQNPEYFLGRYPYVKRWRDVNPEYQKQWRDKRSHEIQTPIPPLSPIKSIRCHLRDNLALDEIQTLVVELKRSGNEIWVKRAQDAA